MRQRVVKLCFILIVFFIICLLGFVHRPLVVAQTYPFQSGFPRFDPRNTISFGSPVVVDINDDGKLEVLTADGNGCVWAWDRNGNVLPNYPLKTAGSCVGTPRISGPLAVGDVDGDGSLEIAAGTRGQGGGVGQRGKTFLWNGDGSLVPNWPQEMAWNTQYGSGLPEVLTVAMANVTGDERLEVIAGTSNNASAGGTPDDDTHNLYVFRGNGTTLPGFPTQYRRAGIWGFVGAGDIDGNGYAEVLTGRDHSFVHAYNAQGNAMPSWPVETAVDPNDPHGLFIEFTRDAPSLADIDNDGEMEIVIAGKVRDPHQNREVTNSALLVLRPNGQRKPGWYVAKLGGAPLFNEYPPTQAAALADLTGDGNLEIVVAMLDGKIRAYKADGTLLWQYNFAAGTRLFASEPIIGDVTGDNELDIVFGTYSPDHSADGRMGVYGLDHQGQPLPGFPLPLNYEDDGTKHGLRGAPTLADLDNDCDVEIIAGSRAGVLYVWDLPAPYHPYQMPWPTARHDYQRTGFVGTAVNTASSAYNPTVFNEDWRIFLPLIANQANPQC
jgi:hypothetical protein